MREHPDKKFLYITPFLTEVERVSSACLFSKPYNIDGKGKLNHLHKLLQAGKSIVSTHQLFLSSTGETAELIRAGGYTLILDEVADVVQIIEHCKSDIDDMFAAGHISIGEDDKLHWLTEHYSKRGAFNKYRRYIENGNAMWLNGELLMWFMTEDMFAAFKEMIVLTYMFDAQIQKYYFDMYGAEYEYIGTRFNADTQKYEFCECKHSLRMKHEYAGKFHILEHAKLNAVGDERTALSKTWYEKHADGVEKLQKHLVNLFQNIWSSPSSDNLWTTFKTMRVALKGPKYARGFVQCREKATNRYAAKTHLAYCLNVYLPVGVKIFLQKQGINPDEDRYALSEMLQ